jgi:hypothetical protein
MEGSRKTTRNNQENMSLARFDPITSRIHHLSQFAREDISRVLGGETTHMARQYGKLTVLIK